MKEYYAKPDQTYKEHLEAVYSAWKEVVEAKRGLINRLSDKYKFDEDRFLKGSLLTVALHDIGKMIEPFQDMMETIREGKRFNYDNNYRHELISFPFVFSAFGKLENESHYSQVPLEALAVVGHHKALDTDCTSFTREKAMGKNLPPACEEGIKYAINIAKELFAKEGWQLPDISEKYTKVNGLDKLSELLNAYMPKLLRMEERYRIRTLYFLLKGILHYADWHGSGNIEVNYMVLKSTDEITEKVQKRCEEKRIDFVSFRPFQKKVAQRSGYAIAVAPTGSGKTEASILWAMNNSKEMGGVKIIYLLPTMATANSMWSRLCEFFGADNVGLTHSSANLIFKKEMEDENENTSKNRNLLFDRTFIRPVTVATVDQLLSTGFNAGHWVLKEINASNAVIILDEIHAYDGWTLGLIVSTVKYFASLGTRFLLMSATMPENLIELFKRELHDVEIIKDTDLLGEVRSKYYVKDKYIQEDEEEIREAVTKGYKVLVVVNTVEQCQKLAKNFENLQPVCFHSRFILKDRKDIEQSIDNASFVIATQIVEVSLDIDYDWLFTECAPPDAIAQRAGRVNRYRDPNRDSRIYIYRATEKAEKIYNPINDEELLKRSFDEFDKAPVDIAEEQLLEIVENVYKHYPFEKREGFEEALEQYSKSQKNRLMIMDNRVKEDNLEKTRQTKYETISVIPYCFYNEVMNAKPNDRKWYEVKIPYWYFTKNKKLVSGLQFCDMVYSKKYGAILKSNEENFKAEIF